MNLADYFKPRNFQRAMKTVRAVLRDPARKPVWRIVPEAVAFGCAKGEFGQYFESRVYRRGATDPLSYLSKKQGTQLRKLAKRDAETEVFDDKLAFQRFFEEVPEIQLPRLLGYTEGGTFRTPGGDEHPLGGQDDASAVAGLLFQSLGPIETVFGKPRSDYGGKGVLKLVRGGDLGPLRHALQSRDYVFQQTVAQHSSLNAVYAGSLNSLRIITCSLASGPEVACARIRFGQGGNVADNASSGGIAGNVALSTGMIDGPCSMHFQYGGTVILNHPDTGHPLVGYAVPLFEQALATALAAARRKPYPIAGWDVGITPGGPVLIEGNSRPNFHGDEITSGGYLANPVVVQLIRELTGGKGL